jgi:hypothetical protein
MPLEDKDILQIYATVIAGLLIFLTISFVEPPSPVEPKPLFSDISIRLAITIFMLSPFVTSATILLNLDGEAKIATEPLRRAARRSTAIGFVFILGNLVALFIAQHLQDIFF